MDRINTLAEALGVARSWHDIFGNDLQIPEERLAQVIQALGYEAETEAAQKRSLARIEAEARAVPKLLTTETGRPTPLPARLTARRKTAEITGEDGVTTRLTLVEGALPPIAVPGYYTLALGAEAITLAVAPPRCMTFDDIGPGKFWGPAVQIPALRGARAGAFGDFGTLAETVDLFAARGADALMINPVHALFPGYGKDFSPYSPSSRTFFNTAMGDPALLGLPALPEHSSGGEFIDWAGAMPERLSDLRAVFDGLSPAQRRRIKAANAAEGPALARHALFDAIDHRYRPTGAWGWQLWPAELHDPESPAVKRFARENATEVEFHAFAQWCAREGLAAVQARAKAAGMKIGLLADLAVGVNTGGSDSWGMREALLQGLTIGAPPDPLGPHGQNWLLTSFSPQGLRATGFAPFIAMLRAALSRAGGLRIDHAFGLARLWVVPEGHGSQDGTYLAYPFEDMMRLCALESHRAQALIVAEDLGTKPYGFSQAIEARGMPGMHVLWFERAWDGGFIGSQDYPEMSLAVTGTHDTATVAGWWTGRDLDWAAKLGRLPEGVSRAAAETERDWDRGRLWATFGAPGPRPEADDPAPAVKQALAHIGRTRARLAIAPLEDILALPEQPNLPGTIDEHPNWRRRLAAPLGDLIAEPETEARIAALDGARKGVAEA
ncbi:MAG: 4-alpha-glucanotransferase [Paenirhodobacter sp.]|uniref:4-alpha-glucanotransferase n=1 Tax=Paenirhodobacter sp. TaxID=1965326 RepID=UPI003D10E689